MAPFFSALVAFGALAWALLAAYRASFKRDEVRVWASECIRVLQTTALLTTTAVEVKDRAERLGEMALKSSVLLEQGRLYFRNRKRDEFGSDKHPAYRGYRPAILDELLVAHQVALRFSSLSAEDQRWAGPIAQSCERRFVSLAQLEVGRIHTAHRYNETAGDGQSLNWLLVQARTAGRITRLELDF